MHLAVVACGDRLEETLTMIKSALLFSLKRITFHIFAEDPLAPQFTERVKFTWQIFTTPSPPRSHGFCVLSPSLIDDGRTRMDPCTHNTVLPFYLNPET